MGRMETRTVILIQVIFKSILTCVIPLHQSSHWNFYSIFSRKKSSVIRCDVINVNCHNVDIIILQWLCPSAPLDTREHPTAAILCLYCRPEKPGSHGRKQPGPGCHLSSHPGFNTRLFFFFTHFSYNVLIAIFPRYDWPPCLALEKFALWQFAQNLAQNCNIFRLPSHAIPAPVSYC